MGLLILSVIRMDATVNRPDAQSSIGGVRHLIRGVRWTSLFRRAMEKRKRKPANIPEALARTVQRLATKEHRNFTAQVIALVEEALSNRSLKPSAKQVMTSLYDLPDEELADVIAISGELLRQRLRRKVATNSSQNLVPGNQIAKLLEENEATCSDVFKELDNGWEQLNYIMEGGKPEAELIPLLAACLPVTQDRLIQLVKEEFGDDQGINHQECSGGCR